MNKTSLEEASQKQSMKREQHKILMRKYISHRFTKKKKQTKNYESKIVSIPLASNSSIWKSIESVAQKQIYLNWAHFHPPATVSF